MADLSLKDYNSVCRLFNISTKGLMVQNCFRDTKTLIVFLQIWHFLLCCINSATVKNNALLMVVTQFVGCSTLVQWLMVQTTLATQRHSLYFLKIIFLCGCINMITIKNRWIYSFGRRCHDTQNNHIQHNDTHYNNTQNIDIQHNNKQNVIFSIMTDLLRWESCLLSVIQATCHK
jgi:hypothetical protein